jgi:hypothetical protein
MTRLSSMIRSGLRVCCASGALAYLGMYLDWPGRLVLGSLLFTLALSAAIFGLCVARYLLTTEARENACGV